MDKEIKPEPSNIENDFSAASQEILECFSLFDKYQTGKMPSKHFEHAAKALGISLTSTEIRVGLEEIEKNGNTVY